jgi:hypothetical protein
VDHTVSTLDRRQLLQATTAIGAIVTLPATQAACLADASASMQAPHFLGVGFWDGREAGNSAPAADAPFRANVIPAATLVARKPVARLTQTASVTVHGFFERDTVNAPKSLSLTAHFRVQENGVDGLLPFHFWDWQAGQQGNRTARFVMPVGSGEELILSADVLRSGGAGNATWSRAYESVSGMPAPTAARTLVFGTATGAGVIPLVKGTYFLAFRDRAGDAEPNWRQYQFRRVTAEKGQPRRLLRRTAAGLIPPDFAYLALTLGDPGVRAPMWT